MARSTAPSIDGHGQLGWPILSSTAPWRVARTAYPDKSIRMVVKRGLGPRAQAAGWSDVVEVDAWETTRIQDVGQPLTL